jgi:hypothetical protein
MAMYTVRVESLTTKGDDDGYEELDGVMVAAGFFKTIQLTSSSAIYELPTGEYNWIGEMNIAMILEAVVNATARISKKTRILVTKVDGIREWYNLKQVG